MSISKESLIEKREESLRTVAEINRLLNEKQQEASNLSQSLTLNQGALYQINALLEELGVDLATLDQEATAEETQFVETEEGVEQVDDL